MPQAAQNGFFLILLALRIHHQLLELMMIQQLIVTSNEMP